MSTMPQETRQAVLQEVYALPEEVLPELLDYVRFLRLRTTRDEDLRERFLSALDTARTIAAQEQINEETIDYEIQQHRTGQ
ncbi:hypothetical protein GC175_07465 [bacterium]|nr:hypothetical protein [bacterium]